MLLILEFLSLWHVALHWFLDNEWIDFSFSKTFFVTHWLSILGYTGNFIPFLKHYQIGYTVFWVFFLLSMYSAYLINCVASLHFIFHCRPSKESRDNLSKEAKKSADNAKVRVRRVRQTAISSLRKQKDSISKDAMGKLENHVSYA